MTDTSGFFNVAQAPRVTQEIVRDSPLRAPFPVDVVQLQAADTTVHPETDEGDFQIESLIASNVTGTADSISLYLVESGGSAGPTNRLIEALPVPANNMVRVFTTDSQLLVPPGFSLVARGGTNDAVNVFGYGFIYQGAYG